jgi:hypothetical protein
MSTDQQHTLIKLLEKERDDYITKVNSITQTIEILKQSVPKHTEDPQSSSDLMDDYDSSLSLKNKILFFFKQEQRFLHSRQLAELANVREPSTSVKQFSAKFSSILSALKKEGKLVKYVINHQNNNTFWGSPKWMDEKGEILSQFMYNKKYVKVSGDSEQFEL